ncbi:MAG: hypothetical protein FWB98_08785, partial [Defluviitaleaceae bacterium]|nr:hypothetical protein [Defluviitaleaceae bacterium]
MTHTVLIEHIRVDGRGGRKTFNVGDKITPSDHELRWFANRFSPLAQGSDANQEADPPKQPEDEPKKSEAEVTPDEEVKAENEGDEAPP